ncbi:hypothetical protein [Nocardia sp. MW-W600-9]
MFGEASVQRIPVTYPAESLVWDGDDLVDPVGGHRRWDAGGVETGPRVSYGYVFDRAVRSPSGAYTVLYTIAHCPDEYNQLHLETVSGSPARTRVLPASSTPGWRSAPMADG